MYVGTGITFECNSLLFFVCFWICFPNYFRKILDPKFSLISVKLSNRFLKKRVQFTLNFTQKLMDITKQFFLADCGLMAYRLPRISALRSSVSQILINLIENGIHKTFVTRTDRYMAAVWNPIMGTEDSQAHVLKISQLSEIFYLYLIGIIVAIAVFILELWWSKKQSSCKQVL